MAVTAEQVRAKIKASQAAFSNANKDWLISTKFLEDYQSSLELAKEVCPDVDSRLFPPALSGFQSIADTEVLAYLNQLLAIIPDNSAF